MSFHVYSVADTLLPLPLLNSTIISEVNFIGTMVGSIVYLSLTTFLSILSASNMKILVLFGFHGFHFVDTKLVLSLLLWQNIYIRVFSCCSWVSLVPVQWHGLLPWHFWPHHLLLSLCHHCHCLDTNPKSWAGRWHQLLHSFCLKHVWTGCQTAVTPKLNSQVLGWTYQWWRKEQVACDCSTICTLCWLDKMKIFELTNRLCSTSLG